MTRVERILKEPLTQRRGQFRVSLTSLGDLDVLDFVGYLERKAS